jgi:hypothetical protein
VAAGDGSFPFIDPVTADRPRIEAGAALTGPNGSPLADAVVHFTFQYLLTAAHPAPQVTLNYPFNLWRADAVTGTDGIARAVLPVWGIKAIQEAYQSTISLWGTPSELHFRVFATYDGGPGLYPQHAELPLTVTEDAT